MIETSNLATGFRRWLLVACRACAERPEVGGLRSARRFVTCATQAREHEQTAMRAPSCTTTRVRASGFGARARGFEMRRSLLGPLNLSRPTEAAPQTVGRRCLSTASGLMPVERHTLSSSLSLYEVMPSCDARRAPRASATCRAGLVLLWIDAPSLHSGCCLAHVVALHACLCQIPVRVAPRRRPARSLHTLFAPQEPVTGVHLLCHQRGTTAHYCTRACGRRALRKQGRESARCLGFVGFE
jgi:hypothetical protein